MTDAPNDLVGPGRVAVVTGAASGIGRALAMAFADASPYPDPAEALRDVV